MTLILVADDDADICELVEFKLSQTGHEVVVAGDGVEALRRFGEHEFDLLLLDCMMPHRTGQQVLSAVRTQPQTRRVPVILMSAHDDHDVVEEGLRLGADAFLAKPFRLDLLTSAIDDLLMSPGTVWGPR